MRHIDLYQVYDANAKIVVGPIMRTANAIPAIRAFYKALGDDKSDLNVAPADFQLIKLGAQDEETGEINSEIQTVATGAGWLAQQRPRDRDATDKRMTED